METIAYEFFPFNNMDGLRHRVDPTYQIFAPDGG